MFSKSWGDAVYGAMDTQAGLLKRTTTCARSFTLLVQIVRSEPITLNFGVKREV